ncbi:MAG TPA: protein kinase [Gemmatimonadaceae bacterium]|nr:protein kinase [Gemmatimonadaceae bacterium]
MDDAASDLTAALGGRYRVERELGAGGMATVYLADDVRHDRRVAIKVLRPDLAAALGAERFLREIRTTASLRHPHIVPLYDSGAGDGTVYYIMPFVEGESLRDRLHRERQLPVDDALRIAAEVADALSYAHGRGVIHRDIKPENILLESGHAVVADFGIAQAIDAAGGERLTQTGVAIGTPAYMSPEQAAGEKDLDARSDVYALACVLYEMLAGQPPFTGPTMESVVHQHLLAAPPAVTQLRPAVPASIVVALQRALSKTPADRFASVSQFAEAIARDGTVHDTPAGAPRRAVRRRWTLVAGALGLVVVVVAAGGLLLMRRSPPPIRLGRRNPVSIDPGLELDPALSPDGKLVAYSNANGLLTVRQVTGGSPVQVVRVSDARGRWPAWLPDGQRLVFVSPRGIEVVSALGGVPRLLVGGTHVARGVTVAPDGRSFAFLSNDSLYAQPLDGGPPKLVARTHEAHSPAWSPDGRWIAFVQGNRQYINVIDLGNLAYSSIWLAPANGGTPHRITDERSLHASPAWASARSLLFVSDQDGGRDAYEISLTNDGSPRGEPVRITTGLGPYSIAFSSDGSRIAYAPLSETSNVWSVPIPATGSISVSTAVPETDGNQLIENVGVSNDGQWLGYSGNRGGTSQVYVMRLGATGPRAEAQQATSDSAGSYWVAWSPDAKEIAFHRFHGERRQIFVSPVEGGAAVPVTDGSEDDRSPEWSPNGRQLLMLENWGTKPAVRVTTRGADGRWSRPRTIPIVIGGDTIASGLSDWSPDGRFIACGCGEGGIVIAPVNGGPARRLASTFSTAGWAFPQWSADGRTVYYVSEDSGRVVAVVGVPVNGGPDRAVVRFDDPTRPWHRYGFRVRAGRIFFTLGSRESDVWVADVERE